jgi:hypothetical protein
MLLADYSDVFFEPSARRGRLGCRKRPLLFACELGLPELDDNIEGLTTTRVESEL